ncbi:S41 family peptidase [Clostridium niameyense]|uniref:S41 family peptidase n=1 Tax=Clostridium niameyense TaxID=1622073 RepID=UPI00067ECD11|nr:S41 family peptidase [Clostridium niameyense]
MKRLRIIFISLIIVIIATAAILGGFKSKYTADPNNRNEKWTKDIEYLEKQLPKKHKNLFFSLSEEKFHKEIESLKNQVPKLNDDEVKVQIYKIVASVNDAHTSAYSETEKTFPINLYWFKEGIYAINTLPEYKEILNCKLIKINGKNIDDVEKETSKIISHENKAQLKNRIPKILTNPSMLHGLKIIDSTEKATFTFQDEQNKIFDVDIKSVKANENLVKKLKSNNRDKDMPLYMQNQDKNYWFKYLKTEKIMYFKYNSCMEMKDKPFKDFSKELLNSIDKNNPEKLVIDLRDNGGGRSSILDSFIKQIKKRNINNKNKLFVILGRRTFSSAILNAITLKNQTEAIFVGEPTGGKPNHYGEVREFKLPNTKMIISYSKKYFETFKEDTPSFMPDKIIEPSIYEFKDNKDIILESIYNYKN